MTCRSVLSRALIKVARTRLRIDGRLCELSTRTTNYQEARRIRQEAVEAHRKGQLPMDLARAPFDRVAEDWLAGRKVRVSPKTYSSDTERLRPLVRAFGGCKLEELVANGFAAPATSVPAIWN